MRNRHWWSAILLTVLVLVSAGTLVLLVRVAANTDALKRQQRQIRDHDREDIQRVRDADYRICTRQMEVRAAIILHVDRTLNSRLAQVLPIFDCAPDLAGKPARRLTPEETVAFLRKFDHREALAP